MTGVRMPRWFSSAIVLVAALPVLVVVPAAVSRAEGDVHYGKLWSSFTRVTTSTGRHVLVRVTAFNGHDPEGGLAEEMHVQVWTPSHSESHAWWAAGEAAGFDYATDRYARLSPATTAYYSVDLQFTPTSKTKTTYCSSDHSTWVKKQTGQLSGMLFVDTHTKKWGTIGSSTREDFVFAPGSSMRVAEGWSYLCHPPPRPCVRTIDIFMNGAKAPFGVTFSATSTRREGTMRGHLRASRTTTTSDSDVNRTDLVSVPAPPLRLRLKNGRATVTIRTRGNATTGIGVTKTVDRVDRSSVSCDARHLRSTTWTGRFANGEAPLTFHTEVFGDLHIADTTDADAYISYTRP